MIHQGHGDGVFGLIDDLLDDLGPAPEYRALFDEALQSVRRVADASAIFLPIDLPMAAGDALGRPDHERHVAAAASTLLWSGADLMDDVADGELPAQWDGVPASQIALVSTNLLATMPHLLVAELDPGDGSVSGPYGEAVSRTLFAMSEGQAADLESARAVRSVEDYLGVVQRKTGTEFALFASTPAILAGLDDEAVAGWVRFGFAYGTMSQVFSDIVGTVKEGPGNDLLLGKRTLPVLHTLGELCDQTHASFVADLDLAAQGDQAALARTIEVMSRNGAVRESLAHVELQRFRATKALPVRLTDLSQDHPLRTMLRACSVL